MEAKDTLMTFAEQNAEMDKAKVKAGCLVRKQAEISFKAGLKQGIWLSAWWKDGVQYVGSCGKTLEEAYKELGIDK